MVRHEPADRAHEVEITVQGESPQSSTRLGDVVSWYPPEWIDGPVGRGVSIAQASCFLAASGGRDESRLGASFTRDYQASAHPDPRLMYPVSRARALFALATAYLFIVLLVTWQRGIAKPEHGTFAIFRQSYVHLARNQDLYARYPQEQGSEPRDRFKYSPSAAVLLSPLASFSYPVALLIWNLANVALLGYAVSRLVHSDRIPLALTLLLPEVLVSIQSSSSNALVAGLMLLSVALIVERKQTRAAAAIIAGAALKLFPLALCAVAMTQRQWRRFTARVVLAAVVCLLLPLAVVGPSELAFQYRSWFDLEMHDAQDVVFGLSVIRLIRTYWSTSLGNWVFQGAGLVVLIAPLLHRARWVDRDFGIQLGCSTLLFCVLFNHQTERATLVVGAAGAVVWLLSRHWSWPLVSTLVVALTGASILPYAVLWIALQFDLHARPTERLSLAPSRGYLHSTSLARVTFPARVWASEVFSRWQVLSLRVRGDARLHRAPDLLAAAFLLAALLDVVTPAHLFLSKNMWDLMSR